MIIDILTIAGIVYIITRSSLFKPIREYITTKNEVVGEIISCPLCCGVYVGAAFFFIPEYIKCFLAYTFIGSLASFAVYLILERIKKD